MYKLISCFVLNLEKHFELEGSIDPLVIFEYAFSNALSKALYKLAKRHNLEKRARCAMASDKGRCILLASFRLKEDASEMICELQTVYIDARNSAKEFDLKDGTRAGQFEKFGDRELQQQLLQNSARTRKELAAQLRSYSSYFFLFALKKARN